jgi:transposase
MHIRYPSKSFDQCLSDWCDTVPEEPPWCDTCDGGSLKGVYPPAVSQYIFAVLARLGSLVMTSDRITQIRIEVVRFILKSSLDSGMNKLDSVDSDALRETLAETTDPKAVKRLMIALAYDDGVSVDTLSERHGIARSTIYSWLDRFEEDSIADAIRDEHRPGRPPLLTEQEREQLTQTLQSPPIEFGFSQDSWTSELVQEHIQQKYDAFYSLGHIRRLIRQFHASE